MFGSSFMMDLIRKQEESTRSPSYNLAKNMIGVEDPSTAQSPIQAMNNFISSRPQSPSTSTSQGLFGSTQNRFKGIGGSLMRQRHQSMAESMVSPQDSQEKGMSIMRGRMEGFNQAINQSSNEDAAAIQGAKLQSPTEAIQAARLLAKAKANQLSAAARGAEAQPVSTKQRAMSAMFGSMQG